MGKWYSASRRWPFGAEDARSMHFRRTQKRKTLALARLLAGLESEARKERPWEPRKAYRLSAGRV